MQGRVFHPGDPGYRVATQVRNKRHEGIRTPRAVALAAHPEDVRKAVLWAREHDVPVVARSGGHSFAGYSLNDGLVVDLSRCSLVDVDESAGLVTTGGGARTGQMHDRLRPYELTVPTGTSPLVGIAGLTLGGGCEYASRKLGLTCDSLVETTLITADGDLLTCNESENPDLFWACRGGGGGNFGINVSFTFRAHQARDVAMCRLAWEWSDAARVIDAVQRLLPQAPHDFSLNLRIATAGIDTATSTTHRVVAISGYYFGSSQELRELVAPLLAVAPVTRQQFVDQTYWEAKGNMAHPSPVDDHFITRTRYVKQAVSDQGIQSILSWMERWPGSSNPDGGGLGMFAWGGAINEVPATDTAFVHRDTMFLASMDASWSREDSCERVRAVQDWVNGLYDDMGSHMSHSSYQNFVDPDLPAWTSAYYGANYARLVEVKRKYDPANVFGFDQGIRP
nr:FAD-binding oxidoreductase [Streptomyces sp. CBMA152]